MALVKCPDCGKMVSERAAVCPECGCPAEYFKQEEKEEIPMLTFQLAGYQINEPKEFEWYAHVFGNFVKLSKESIKWLTDLYIESKNIEKVLEKVPQKAGEILNAAAESVIKAFYSFGIHMTAEEFLEKYYYSHKIDYEQYYAIAIENYATIADYKEQLANYRSAQIASRGRWVGGGFGIKGAIKGAVSASLMNAGSDFIHSFGDNARQRADERKVNQMLADYYNLPNTKKLLCDSIGECILQVYFAMTEELKQQGVLPTNIFGLDRKKAYTLYKHTIEYEEDDEQFIHNMVQCIALWPTEKAFYDEIIGVIYADLGDEENQSNFYAFLEYWDIAELFEKKTLKRPQTEMEKVFVERIITALEGTVLEDDMQNELIDIPVQSLPPEQQRVFITAVKEPFIGNHLIFCSEEYLLTDFLISDFEHDAVMISSIKNVVNKQIGILSESGEILDSGNILFETNDNKNIVWEKTGSCDGRTITALINYGIHGEEAKTEWEDRVSNYKVGKGFKKNNIPIDIKTEDDYIKGMKYFVSSGVEDGYCFWQNAEANLFLKSLSKWEISGTVNELEWISKDLREESFWYCIEFVGEFQKSYFSKLWSPINKKEKFAPNADVRGQLKSYGELKLFKEFGELKLAGFAVTDQYFVILSEMAAIRLEDITDIKIASKGQIMVKDAQNEYFIKVAGILNNDDNNWNEFPKLQQIINVIAMYAIRYRKNGHLTLEAEKKKRKKVENSVEIFESYMKEKGYDVNSDFGKSIEEAQKLVATIGNYLCENDHIFPEEEITTAAFIEALKGNIEPSILGSLCRWTGQCELLENEKIFDHLPELCAEEYWTLAVEIIGILKNKRFAFLKMEHPTYKEERLMKTLLKMNVDVKKIFLHVEVDKMFSLAGFSLTETEIIDYAKKQRIKLVDVDRIEVPAPYRSIRLYTKDSVAQLLLYDIEEYYYTEGVKLFAAALKQYILRLRKLEKIENVKDEPVVGDIDEVHAEKFNSEYKKSVFVTRFEEKIANSSQKQFAVMQMMEQIRDKSLAEKLAYQKQHFPGQYVLYFKDRVYFSDQYFNWGTLFKPINELESISWDRGNEKPILINLKNGEKYCLKSEGHDEKFVELINYALGQELSKETLKETIFCPYCGKQISRTAKFCQFCGKANNYGKERLG